MTFGPSKDSDQPARPPSVIRAFAVHMTKQDPQLPIEHTAKTDQIGLIPILILVFPGHTGHSVGFVMRWLR